jgi:protein-disulfide isomerase
MWKNSLFLAVLLILGALWQPCRGEADLEVLRRIELDANPLDVAVSRDGLWAYVLTDTGLLLVYSRNGALQGTLTTPEGSRRIAMGPEEDVLYVTNTADHTLQAIRVNLEFVFSSEHSPSRGAANAPVTVTLFTDFQCPYCAGLAPIVDQVHRFYPDKVQIVFKNFPLVRIHRFAFQAALAALAAEDQGQFWPFQDRLFQNYTQLDPQKIEEIRKELGLDAERFKARMIDPALKNLIRRDLEEGRAAGVHGTPAVYINGKKFRGKRSLEGFRAAIEAILVKSKAEEGH